MYGHIYAVHLPHLQLVSVRLVPANRFRARYEFSLWASLAFMKYSLSLQPGSDPLHAIAISYAIFTKTDLKIRHYIRIAFAEEIISAISPY